MADAEPDSRPANGGDTQVVNDRPNCIVRAFRFVKAHSLYYSGVVLAMVAAGFLGFGLAKKWGTQQWGSYADWIVGGLTLAAVSVALWQAFRGEHARRVEHEIARRRECLQAVGDVWTGLAQMSLYFTFFTDYLENLPEAFNPNYPRQDNVPPDRPGEPIAYEIGQRVQDFANKWTELVEPPLFVALALLKDTPFDKAMIDINTAIRDLMEKELPNVLKFEIMTRRPETATLNAKWKAITGKREEHLNLTRKHFSLDLAVVERELFRPALVRPPEIPTPEEEAQG